MWIPDGARFSDLVKLPESDNLGEAVNAAMRTIEESNEAVRGILPKNYTIFENDVLATLLKTFRPLLDDPKVEGDMFGKIYEYFLAEFARKEGQKGGEFFTPPSLVKLIVECLEPYKGRIFDPACGSGGMFVQSADFVRHHARDVGNISVFGTEKTEATVPLCKMNLAVHGLEADIIKANSYYDNPHNLVGRFDFVMANPPFNVNSIDRDRLKGDARFPFGMPNVDNGNYIWIQLFYAALNESGRAGFVMANSAADARGSELEIRKQIIMAGAVDVMISIGPNFFYTVTLPCTLWFFDKSKTGKLGKTTKAASERANSVLFLDARHIFRQIDRAHREFSPEQLDLLSAIVRLFRGEDTSTYELPADISGVSAAQLELIKTAFATKQYTDIAGLCKVARIEDVEAQGWSLNPGRYVGVPDRVEEDFDFRERLEEMNEELLTLTTEAHELEEMIARNVAKLLE